MTLIEFVQDYIAVRAAQQTYFSARRAGQSGAIELDRSRKLEKHLDGVALKILADRTRANATPPWEAAL